MNEYQRLAAEFHERDPYEQEDRDRFEDDKADYFRDMERENSCDVCRGRIDFDEEKQVNYCLDCGEDHDD